MQGVLGFTALTLVLSLQASYAKAKAGRMGSDVTLRCVELAGTFGYSEVELLEKWGRDSKILDIFEGTQQIQQLIVARRLLAERIAMVFAVREPGRADALGGLPELVVEGDRIIDIVSGSCVGVMIAAAIAALIVIAANFVGPYSLALSDVIDARP